MRWDRRKRKYWDVGEVEPYFRVSKERSQKFIGALIRCDGQIHDSFSLDIHDGKFKYETMKIHQTTVSFRISLPEGAEDLFEQIMCGMAKLTEPPKFVLNCSKSEMAN